MGAASCSVEDRCTEHSIPGHARVDRSSHLSQSIRPRLRGARAGRAAAYLVCRDAFDRDDPVERAAKSLNILILGGTGFTGPEQVEYAIARGHKVTLINRNKTRPDFFKGRVEQLIGDLNGDMSALKGLKFDVVIDNPTTAPAWVRNVAQYLKGNTNHYIFISTISAYANDKNVVG